MLIPMSTGLIYPRGGPWDLNTASYDSVSFSVSGQDGNPQAVSFKPDGTKMYLLGSDNDLIYQYSLSTAWDIGTASYDSVSFSVASQQTSPTGLHFKPDGTKAYVVGIVGALVHQYSLSTAWNLSTASYDSVSFSVTSEDTGPRNLTLKDDGTKLYVVGSTGDSVYQYSLSTAWDISTASYDSVSFSVASQDTFPIDVTFKDDGTKMYVNGINSDSIHQYSLSTPWALNTASYDSVSFSVASQDGNGRGIAFKTDGTKMYFVGATSPDAIYQYSLG